MAQTTPPILDDATTPPNNGILKPQSKPNVPVSEIAKSSPIYHATPKPDPTRNPQATVTAGEIGVANTPNPLPAWVTPNPKQLSQSSYTAPLKQQIQNLDNVLQKRIQTHIKPVFGSVQTNSVRQNNGYSPATNGYSPINNGYQEWSSYGPCSASCGVGMRRRTRVCRPGFYCVGPAAETRACIKEQCACEYPPQYVYTRCSTITFHTVMQR